MNEQSHYSKRERKPVAILQLEGPNVGARAVEIEKGDGCKLADLPEVMKNLEKAKQSSFSGIRERLHSIIWFQKGKAAKMASHFREFSGLDSSKDTFEAKKRKLADRISKCQKEEIKLMCGIFCLHHTGSKEEISEKLLNFLIKPDASLQMPKKKIISKPTQKKAIKTVVKKAQGSKKSLVEKKKKVEEKEIEDTVLEEEHDADTTSEEEDLDVSNQQLADFISEYLKSADLMEISKKSVRLALESHFQVSLKNRKEVIGKMVEKWLRESQYN